MSQLPRDNPELEIWLCPIHQNLDTSGQLKPLDNCVACIRVQRDELEQQVESLRAACAAAYQFCGAAGADEKLLDNLLALAQGEKAPHEEWPICTGEWTFEACGHTSAVGCLKCAEQQIESLRAERDALKLVVDTVDDVLVVDWVGPRTDGDYKKALADLVTTNIQQHEFFEVEQLTKDLAAEKQRAEKMELVNTVLYTQFQMRVAKLAELTAELAASAEVIKKTQDIYDDTVRECLDVRGQLDAEKQRADALESALKAIWPFVRTDNDFTTAKFEAYHAANDQVRALLDAARKPVPQEPAE